MVTETGGSATVFTHERPARPPAATVSASPAAHRMKRGRPPRAASTASGKPTHTRVKEAFDALAAELAALEDQVEALRVHRGLPSRDAKRTIDGVRSRNAQLEERIHQSRRHVTRIRSLVSHEMLPLPVNPLHTFIHLPRELDARRAILRGMSEFKLRRAEQVAMESLHHLDPTMPYVSEERFTTEDGCFHCRRQVVHQFPNFQTARQLYDVAMHYFYNMEITVAEYLDQLAVREDSDELNSSGWRERGSEPTVWNQRIVTVADDIGCTEELNSVKFARFVDASEAGGSPHGIIATDTVDVDDLYPYRPQERTRKCLQGAYFFVEVPTPGASHGETLVVFKNCAFSTQLPPQFELRSGVLEKLHEHISRWPEVMLKHLHDYTPSDATTA